MIMTPRRTTLFPYTTLFRSIEGHAGEAGEVERSVSLRRAAEVALAAGADDFERLGLPERPLNRRRHVLCVPRDRKSTRLNSSHLGISYAVFCLKKKKNPRYH